MSFITPVDLINKTLSTIGGDFFAYKSIDQNNLLYGSLNENENTKIYELDVRSGAGLIPSGFNKSNGKVNNIITSGYSLPYFINSIESNAGSKWNFNTAALNYVNDTLVNDYLTPLDIAEKLNLITVTPVNHNEIEKTTVLAYILANFVNDSSVNGSINLFDGINYTKDKLNYATSTDVDAALVKLNKLVKQDTFANVLNQFNQITGWELDNFNYVGNATNPELVFVTYGSVESELFNNSLKHFDNSNYGIINIRIPLPFDTEKFLQLLPSSVKKIIVINQIGGNNNNVFNNLLQKINYLLFTSKKLDIKVDQYNYDLNFIWSQFAVNNIISTFTKTSATSPISAASDHVAFWLNDNNTEFTSVPSNLLSLFTSEQIVFKSKFNNIINGGTYHAQLQFNSENIGNNLDVNSTNLSVVSDIKLLSEIDVVATLAPGADLIVVLPEASKADNDTDLVEFIESLKLSNTFIEAIKAKEIKLTLVNSLVGDNIDLFVQGLVTSKLNKFKFEQFVQLYDSTLDKAETIEWYNKFVDENVFDVDVSALKIAEIQEEEDTKEEEEDTEMADEPTPLPIFINETSFVGNPFNVAIVDEENDGAIEAKTNSAEDISKILSFKEAYGATNLLRPDLPVENYVIKVKSNKRVTPEDYDRYIFQIEFDIAGTGMKYDIGEALGIHARNNEDDVLEFLNKYNYDPSEVVLVPNKDDNTVLEARTVLQSFMDNLDIFGKPPKKFYESLVPFVSDETEKTKLTQLIAPEGAVDLKNYQDVQFFTYADIIELFPSCQANLKITDLVKLIAPLKRREYSIASSQRVHPNEVHLLIVVVDWIDAQGRKRFGQASKYISDLRVGQELVVSVKPSVMKLPPRSEQPVIMSGLGTGLAPFKAIVEEKMWQMQQGMQIGEIYLFLGSRHKREEYLYGELWEAYKDAGIITHIGAAFSRDQPEKIYIQDRIRQVLPELKKAMVENEGSFYLCGPTWPVPDITAALEAIYSADAEEKGIKIDLDATIEELKESSRYILEVY